MYIYIVLHLIIYLVLSSKITMKKTLISRVTICVAAFSFDIISFNYTYVRGLCVYESICLCESISQCTRKSARLSVYAPLCTCLPVSVHVNQCSCLCVTVLSISVCMCPCMCVCVRAHAHVHALVCVHRQESNE